MRSITRTARGLYTAISSLPNLLLDSQGNVWVADFGLVKVLEGEEFSHSHDVVGTLRFIAPERFRGVTIPQGDVYSLGATLYELSDSTTGI